VRQARFERLMAAVAAQSGIDAEEILSDTPRPPDRDRDPVGHLEVKMQELLTPLQQKLEKLEQQEQEKAITSGIERVESYHNNDIAQVRQEVPDYDDAEEYLIGVVERQTWDAVVRANPDLTDDEIAERVEYGLQKVAAELQVQHAARRTSLARDVYRKAIELGYTPAQARQQAGPQPKRTGPKTANLRRNLESGAGMGGGRPSGRSSGLSLNALLDPSQIDDDAFDELTSKPGAWKRLVGASG
jgi:hypothetical protein